MRLACTSRLGSMGIDACSDVVRSGGPRGLSAITQPCLVSRLKEVIRSQRSGVRVHARTVSEWPLADCGQRMQLLSSVAYNWPPRPTNFRTSLSTLLSVVAARPLPCLEGPTMQRSCSNLEIARVPLRFCPRRAKVSPFGACRCEDEPLVALHVQEYLEHAGAHVLLGSRSPDSSRSRPTP